MTQEEKNLLLQDLCARLPYGVLCKTDNKILQLKDVYVDGAVGNEGQLRLSNCKYGGIYQSIDEVRPYLRPMSSMTFDESLIAKKLNEIEYNDFLNAHHFDYRGLIEKGLALEAPEDMYQVN